MGKYTYLDAQIKMKKKIPSVGKYNIEHDHTEQIRKKYKTKGDIERKSAPVFRPTALQQINRDTMRVAPGDY